MSSCNAPKPPQVQRRRNATAGNARNSVANGTNPQKTLGAAQAAVEGFSRNTSTNNATATPTDRTRTHTPKRTSDPQHRHRPACQVRNNHTATKTTGPQTNRHTQTAQTPDTAYWGVGDCHFTRHVCNKKQTAHNPNHTTTRAHNTQTDGRKPQHMAPEPDTALKGDNILDIPVEEELSRSFIEYAMSVVHARALPDIRDGLKPVHRRILYGMHQMGLQPNKPYKKSARAVGDIMGKYHPHGDASLYETLVRLGQAFHMSVPLVDGHGNFGSLDDPAAASRYTEARLSSGAVAMCADLHENTVNYRPNYDGTETEPEVLPAGFCNLLVNGTQGIAVGMATTMAPHNIHETTELLCWINEQHTSKQTGAKQPVSIDDAIKRLPGPDFPSGCGIVDDGGIAEAYRTGRGSVTMRAVATTGTIGTKQNGITITALPYQTGPEKIVDAIKTLLRDKKIEGIRNVVDYSDRRNGLRLIVETKTGYRPAAVLAELYRLTPLEQRFNINAVALIDNQPAQISLLDICNNYLNHRRDVVTRRTKHRKTIAETRLHIVDGLIKALGQIDEIVALIRGSRTADTARKKLLKQKYSPEQAEHILNMALRRLTSLETNKLKTEAAELKTTIKQLDNILNSDVVLAETINNEMRAVAEQHTQPRRCRIISPDQIETAGDLEEPDEPCWVTYTHTGSIGKQPAETGRRNSTDDLCRTVLATTTRSNILAINDQGTATKIHTAELGDATKRKRGHSITEHAAGNTVAFINETHNDNETVVLVTETGKTKRIRCSEWPKTSDIYDIVKLDTDDKVAAAFTAGNNDHIVIVTQTGQVLRFEAATVRPQGRSGGGVTGIKLADDDKVIAAGHAPATNETGGDGTIVYAVAVDDGAHKQTSIYDIPVKGRAGQGVRGIRFLKTQNQLQAAYVGTGQGLVGIGERGGHVMLDTQHKPRDASTRTEGDTVTGFAQRRPRHDPPGSETA